MTNKNLRTLVAGGKITFMEQTTMSLLGDNANWSIPIEKIILENFDKVAGDHGIARVGCNEKALAGVGGIAKSEFRGTSETRYMGVSISGLNGTSITGEVGVAIIDPGGGKGCAGEGGVLVFRFQNHIRIEIVGENGIKANVMYTLTFNDEIVEYVALNDIPRNRKF